MELRPNIRGVFLNASIGLKSHSKRVGGTGLGLSIVKHAARLHNADIEMKSNIGNGTEVIVRFPRNNEITIPQLGIDEQEDFGQAYVEGFLDGAARTPESQRRYLETIKGKAQMGYNATVAVHINRLREKLEKSPAKPRYIETVWGAGYRFRG